jgi:hypothetical protein
LTNRVYIDRHGKATPRLKRIMAAIAERHLIKNQMA